MKTGKNIKTKFRYVKKKAPHAERAKQIARKDIFVGQMMAKLDSLQNKSQIVVGADIGPDGKVNIVHGKRRSEKDTLDEE